MVHGDENLPALLANAGLRGPFQLTDLPGGGNNKVYRIDCDGKKAFLKVYFRDAGDTRDRLAAEFSFCTFAWNAGIRLIPRPLAQDPAAGLGLYEFLEGRPLRDGEVDIRAIEHSVCFFRELNNHKSAPQAASLPPASDSCFTMHDHLARVDRRLKRFDQLDRSVPSGEEAYALVHHRLIPKWERIRAYVIAGGVAMNEPVLPEDRCLSPSDFGFHNSIADASGSLKFIDFEYAGWDDPANAVGDFFCQPRVTVPMRFFETVSRAFVEGMSDPAAHLRRITLLLPVLRVKWCCIMLNEFLPVDSRRRSFANEPTGEEERRRAQLQKVRMSLDALKS